VTGPRFDPRLTPIRDDLAAAHLAGVAQAPRFEPGVLYQVSAGVAPLRRAPAPDARQESQLLFGEMFTVYDEAEGFGWGQAAIDGYVGYVDMSALSAPPLAPTHRVAALRTYVFAEADLKTAPVMLLSLNAAVTVEALEGRYAKIARSGWVAGAHLAAIDAPGPEDWVAVAERFLGAPYFWGGKESLGLDCSGLVQMAMHAAGLPCPRDSDMQEDMLGSAVDAALEGRRRGDLVFWNGHVGIMLDAERMIHANAHHMAVAIEPLADAATRIAATSAGPIRTVRRL
jgi:cell wall-associated NlpC family hydrolase